MVNFKLGSNKPRAQRALATLADDEEQQQEVALPYTEVNLDGNVSSTSLEETLGGSSSSNNISPGTQIDKPVMGRRLTEVSKKYDREGKGYLNETEQALRRLDSTNKGFLDEDKVCGKGPTGVGGASVTQLVVRSPRCTSCSLFVDLLNSRDSMYYVFRSTQSWTAC